MLLLRIKDVPAISEVGRSAPHGIDEARRRIEMTWQEGRRLSKVVSSFIYEIEERDAERIRWYLEDYGVFPADPAPRLAAEAEACIENIGSDLFRLVFSDSDAAKIWALAQRDLGQVRVEVDADQAGSSGLPWELLRDPNTGINTALEAAAFVRTHIPAGSQGTPPEATEDVLRVLLVICRPGRGDDVPFRSVATTLVRGGANHIARLDLDVLRPATFTRLSEVLHAAAGANRPYHVVHFDGHGTFLDVTEMGVTNLQTDMGSVSRRDENVIEVSPLPSGLSVVGPIRAGKHGYLLFEDPSSHANMQLADGSMLGRLLAATHVPVLVLNACRSAYAEAADRPGSSAGTDRGVREAHIGEDSVTDVRRPSDGAPNLPMDVHTRIRAYGSLAAEVAEEGVPGVVAMRYNVYVATAAQFIADLYSHLLAGESLGQSATAARRQLATDSTRTVGAKPVLLQDWIVPVVYESTPLNLVLPHAEQTQTIKLALSGSSASEQANSRTSVSDGRLPAPNAGFFGRDETLLELDRAFDTHQVVMLYGYAGAGKSSTAAEFARWYQGTGGLDHPTGSVGTVIWSSFEHHLPLNSLLSIIGDEFAPFLEQSGIHWHAIAEIDKRLELVFKIFAEFPVLWIWDNVEPVKGFPDGMPSEWTQAEQKELAEFASILAQRTLCKILLTTRRKTEYAWLGDLPVHISLPPMPMHESLQLARAIAQRRGVPPTEIDWRPLLRYARGNPLTITVVINQAMHEQLASTADIEAFVNRLYAGEVALEGSVDSALADTRPLAVSLRYGFSHAFGDSECGQLALLYLFRNTVTADVLFMMGQPEIAGDDAVPELSALNSEEAVMLLDRAVDIGFLTPAGDRHYHIHPALSWYFSELFAATFSPPNDARATRAYAAVFATAGDYWYDQYNTGQSERALSFLAFDEANLQHSLTVNRDCQNWADAMHCLMGLRILYENMGRIGRWAQLLAEILPCYIDLTTDEPLPDREAHWHLITEWRADLAMFQGDWQTAGRLSQARLRWAKERFGAIELIPDSELNESQRVELSILAVAIEAVGHILFRQGDPECLTHYNQALGLFRRVKDRAKEGRIAGSIGNAYLEVPNLRDLGQADYWFQYCIDRTSDHDRMGRLRTAGSLGQVAVERFREALEAGTGTQILSEHFNRARNSYQTVLELAPQDDAHDLALAHNQLGILYSHAGRVREALNHYQQAISYRDDTNDLLEAGHTRYNVAFLYAAIGRLPEALHYARAALRNYEHVGPGAAQDATLARQLIVGLERLGE